jgi:hypothetical protein
MSSALLRRLSSLASLQLAGAVHERGLILQRNAKLRAEPGALRDLSFGRLALSIPYDDWKALRARYPELGARDVATRSAAWRRFIASSESLPYRVGTKP